MNGDELGQVRHVHELHVGCRYCEIDRHEPTVRSSAVLAAVPSVGSLVEGWVLAFPRQHVLALSDLSPAQWSAYVSELTQVRSAVNDRYGETILFEHGSAGSARLAGCGVDHAHMHIVPVILDIRSALADMSDVVGELDWMPVEGQVPTIAGQDYLYIDDRSGRWVAYSPSLPGQAIRRAIARAVGAPEWDWKASPNRNLMASTLSRMRAA